MRQYRPTPKIISLMELNGSAFLCSYEQAQEYINEMRGYRDKKKHLNNIESFFRVARRAIKARHMIRKRLH